MSRPMYRTIAEHLQEQIETGTLQPGAQLPTEVQLQETYRASRNTVRDAIKWLIQLGVVETRPGQGTFVRIQPEPLVNTIGPYQPGEVAGHLAEVAAYRRVSFSPAQVEIQAAPPQLASALLLPEGSHIISRHERLYAEGTPWSLQTAFYPMELADRGAHLLLQARNIEPGTLSYLRETLGIRMETWRAWLSARTANATEAEFFQLRYGSAVVEILQTYREQSGTPYCLMVATYPSDRNLFQVAAGRVPSLDELRTPPAEYRAHNNPKIAAKPDRILAQREPLAVVSGTCLPCA